MRSVSGQALRACGILVRVVLALAILAGLGLGALSWRLAQGPLHLPLLARGLEWIAARSGETADLRIGDAAIAWSGFRDGNRRPLELRVANLQLRDASGAVRQELPNATVTLSFTRLLRGHVAPAQISLQGLSIVLERDREGGISLAMGQPAQDGLPPKQEAGEASSGNTGVLRELLGQGGHDSPFSTLRGITLSDGQLTILDRQLGIVWRLDQANLVLQRRPDGSGVEGQGSAALRLPGHGNAVPVRLSGSLSGNGAAPVVEAHLSLPALEPARLAGLMPSLAPLAMFDAPVSLDLSGRFDGSQPKALPRLNLVAEAGGGGFVAQGHRVGFAGLQLRASVTPEEMTLETLRLTLPPAAPPAAPSASTLPAASRPDTRPRPAPVVVATGKALLAAGRWRGGLEVTLDQLQAADLQAYWPPGVGDNPRKWVLENITAGTFRDGRFSVKAEAAEDLGQMRVTDLTGSLRATDATVHWLRPIPPMEGGMATATFGLKQIEVRADSARQSGSGLTASAAVIRFTALDTNNEQAEIEARVRGPVPDAVAILRHPRLHLFEKRPLDLTDPGGQLDATVKIAFPLLADIPAEVVRVALQAKLTNLRLADVLMGKRLERGTADLSVDNTKLRATGTAQLAGIPTKLAIDMDFRSGPPSQVVERIRAEARPDAARIAEFGLDLEGIVTGPVGVEALLENRRGGDGRVTLTADLGDSRMAVPPLAWRKPAGRPATARAELRLQENALRAVENFRVEAPALLIRGRAAFGNASRLQGVELQEATIGNSRFTGEAEAPGQTGGAWRIRLAGPVLDVAPALAESDGPDTPDSGDVAPLTIDGRFDRVTLGGERVLSAVQGSASADGRGVLRSARFTGQAGPRGAFDLAVTPDGAGRRLQLHAANAGALLRAFDVLHQVQDGKLSVTGRWPSNAPGATLTGTAQMEDFSIQGAAGVGKLLQALTVYGVFDAVRGTGLSFNRMVAPFTLSPDALTLQGARAFSSSLGVTAKGQILRKRGRIDLEGTIVPAYVVNSLLGQIPLLGRLFSPEQGGGLFAATWSMTGPIDDPSVSVNPLAALTPGFLRGIFGGAGDGKAGAPIAPPAEAR
jgi:hypothetical protein